MHVSAYACVYAHGMLGTCVLHKSYRKAPSYDPASAAEDTETTLAGAEAMSDFCSRFVRY